MTFYCCIPVFELILILSYEFMQITNLVLYCIDDLIILMFVSQGLIAQKWFYDILIIASLQFYSKSMIFFLMKLKHEIFNYPILNTKFTSTLKASFMIHSSNIYDTSLILMEPQWIW